jgi:hypothetical protein
VKKKTKKHLLLLEPEQKEEWRRKAKEAGMTLNKYIRSCVERRKIRSQKSVNLGLLVELSRIGNNLNQQTKAINTSIKSEELPKNWEENLRAIEELTKIIKEIQAEIMGLGSSDREDYEG